MSQLIEELSKEEVGHAVGYYIQHRRHDLMQRARKLKAEGLAFRFVAKRKRDVSFWDRLWGRLEDMVEVTVEVVTTDAVPPAEEPPK